MSSIKDFFGFKFLRNAEDSKETAPTFSPEVADDGSFPISAAAGFYGTFIDIEGLTRSETELVRRYREISLYPEVDQGIQEIVDEAICEDANNVIVKLDLERVDIDDRIKGYINKEFDQVLSLLNFHESASDTFRRWYVDGKLYYHIIIDPKDIRRGIVNLRLIDSIKMKKVTEYETIQSAETGTRLLKRAEEYFVYSDSGFGGTSANSQVGQPASQTSQHLKISPDTILYCNSGLSDPTTQNVLSYLHGAIRPANQLRMMEDAVVIYRNSRASERRIFKIPVGHLPKAQQESYMMRMIEKYRNKVVYDGHTGCFDMDTMVPLLDGRTMSIRQISEEMKDQNVKLWAYSVDPKTGKFAPGLITWAGVTRRNSKVMRITLDNGEQIVCTLDHNFPVWNRGKVEAKDLKIGDSMVPHYCRLKEISAAAKNSKYEQIFDNESKKWLFTHRLVSNWKDSVGLDNEYVFNEAYADFERKTVHHSDYNRLNNTPENLCRMNREDHFEYHKKHSSIAGKIGGAVSGKICRDLGLGIFSLTPEQKSAIGRKVGLEVGPRMVAEKKGIHGISREETKKNSIKGVKKLAELMLNEEYRSEFGQKIKAGLSAPETKKRFSELGKKLPLEHFLKMSQIGNQERWKSAEAVAAHSHGQTVEYTEELLDLVKKGAEQLFSIKQMVDFINSDFDVDSWKEKNKEKKIRGKGKKTFECFTENDLRRIVKMLGFTNYRELRQSFRYKNHKIANIEFIDDVIDVGTLTIDGKEQYHDYHTFALDAGIYTYNSVRDDKKFMSMQEDIWLPVYGDGKSTDVSTLPGGQNLSQIEDVVYFRQKLYQALRVPIGRLQEDKNFQLGRTADVTRDELKFMKFIKKLRRRFSGLILDALKVQCILRGIMTIEEWEEIVGDIVVEFSKDNNFVELKEMELLNDRLELLGKIDGYIGTYFSRQFVYKHVLGMNSQESDEMIAQIEKERAFNAAEYQPAPTGSSAGGGGFGDLGGGLGGSPGGSEFDLGGEESPIEQTPATTEPGEEAAAPEEAPSGEVTFSPPTR